MRFIKDGYGFFRACVASWQDLGCRFSLDSRPIHLGIFRFPFLFQILVDSELVLGVVALFDDWTMGEGGGRRERVALQRVPDVFGRFLLTTLTVGGVAEVFFFFFVGLPSDAFKRHSLHSLLRFSPLSPLTSFHVASRHFPSLPAASRRFPSLPVVSRRFPPLQLFYHQPPQSIQ